METKEKKILNWVMVLLLNIGTIFWVGMHYPYGNESDIITLLIILGISIFVSAVPMLISKSNFKFKNLLGYGIPVLLFLTTAYFIWLTSVCTGKFCGIGYALLAIASTVSAIIFLIYYIIGVYSKKMPPESVLALSIVIPFFIIAGITLLTSSL